MLIGKSNMANETINCIGNARMFFSIVFIQKSLMHKSKFATWAIYNLTSGQMMQNFVSIQFGLTWENVIADEANRCSGSGCCIEIEIWIGSGCCIEIEIWIGCCMILNHVNVVASFIKVNGIANSALHHNGV